ncbi:hypothetical protein SETIT_9G136400v2 [Setaria italica]|uniref:rRNA N-glycosylase n=1 Tax=Setaria italica TaxID=4555 RepID=K4AIB0_SETIT|nr:uncharacterized protein LOC106804509 [Setaria italica]RCV41439.1 hypothetical protein SETIT_9G136400v2 [Setaria italica]
MRDGITKDKARDDGAKMRPDGKHSKDGKEEQALGEKTRVKWPLQRRTTAGKKEKTRVKRSLQPRCRTGGSTLLLVWMMILVRAHAVQCGYVPVDVTTEEFYLTERPHAEIFGIIYNIAIDVIPRLEVRGHHFLGVKDPERLDLGGDGSAPGRWIKVPLRGETDEDRVTLCFADTDLYLLAFMNNVGTWHCFRGYENMFPGCVVLNPVTDKNHPDFWNEQYPQLITDGFKKMHTVPLGKRSALEAARILGRHRHGTTPLPELKSALLRSMIMFSEAFRFRVIREAFSGDLWETETHLTQPQAALVVNWTNISVLLWKWDREGKWPENRLSRAVKDETEISSAEEALDVVDLLRRPRAVRIRVAGKGD